MSKPKTQKGLEEEIEMLRDMMRKVVTMSNGVESLDEAVAALRALGSSASHLASLIKAQKSLGVGDVDVSTALSQAIQEVTEELKQWSNAQ